MPEKFVSQQGSGTTYESIGVFYATVIGLFGGLGIGKITEYYTGTGTKPVESISKQSMTGPATNIIAGLGVGMESTAVPIMIISGSIMGAYYFAGLYGIAMGPIFFGESMFYLKSGASKVALHHLCTQMDFELIDVQIPTTLMENFGAYPIQLAEFLDILQMHLHK